ncbi:hypothetical protein [Streptomyces sp. NPDC057052]|uniref:hypothetical protein n=1 Tax=Streptomyces sp. NPDC057052 TaxID=3346010 RepID=UPI003634DBAD
MITSQGIGASMHSIPVGSDRLRLALELVAGTAALSRLQEREAVTTPAAGK